MAYGNFAQGNHKPTAVIDLQRNDGSNHWLDQFDSLIRTAMDGCKMAENLATCHQKRPCFKKIDSLCARLRQDLVKSDNVMSNINSQGLAWAVKDFIFVFTRIMNAWIIIKGYVHSQPEALTSIQRELCPNFLDAFGHWHQATHGLIQSLIKSFINLNNLAKMQRGSGNAFSKVEEPMACSVDAGTIGRGSDNGSDEPGESEVLEIFDGSYIPTGVYINTPRCPPGFDGHAQSSNNGHDSSPGGHVLKSVFGANSLLNQNEPAFSQTQSKERLKSFENENVSEAKIVQRDYMNQVHRKASKDCISWVLGKVCEIEEAQYLYSTNFAKNYFPDYHLIAKYKCDLQTIYRKNEMGDYFMLSDLLEDLHRVVDTCKDYLNASGQFELWSQFKIVHKYSTETSKKELENYPKMQTFIKKMESIFSSAERQQEIIMQKIISTAKNGVSTDD
ncbi:uncharacterized protein LOC128722825 [Anopheles nili]|uniref:uncharacterized protein LOC128722825 n=1 Tax=Anopheles nili TaxID=185578 RepID=UPI00237A287D|nr:uncharacterized protein LOC128722825 [Anopheles nili]